MRIHRRTNDVSDVRSGGLANNITRKAAKEDAFLRQSQGTGGRAVGPGRGKDAALNHWASRNLSHNKFQ